MTKTIGGLLAADLFFAASTLAHKCADTASWEAVAERLVFVIQSPSRISGHLSTVILGWSDRT